MRNEGNVALPYAIYDRELLIGFVIIGYGTMGDEEEPYIFKDNYILWRLTVDQQFQGKGHVKYILGKVANLVKKGALWEI